jgi:hypothetical protein
MMPKKFILKNDVFGSSRKQSNTLITSQVCCLHRDIVKIQSMERKKGGEGPRCHG